MGVDVQASDPIVGEYVTAVNADGSLQTKRVDYSELSFFGLYGARSLSDTTAPVAYGLQTFVFDNVDGVRVDYTVQGRVLAEPGQYIYGIVRSVDTTNRNVLVFVTIAPGAASGAVYSEWEFQVAAGPSFGIVASATTGYMTASMAMPSVGNDLSFTTDTGKAFTAGSVILVSSLASATGPASSVNYFEATVVAYNSGTGAVHCHVTRVGGSGTYIAWIIQRSAPVADFPGYISGMTVVFDPTVDTNAITVLAGSAIDSTDTVMMYLRSSITKVLGANWSAGAAQGLFKNLAGTVAATNGSNQIVGTGTAFLTDHTQEMSIAGVLYASPGSPADDTHQQLFSTYLGTTASGLSYAYTPLNNTATVFAILKDADGTVDIIAQMGTSKTLTGLPAGYTYYVPLASMQFVAGGALGARNFKTGLLPFGAAGADHTEGLVPDPGSGGGTSRLLCEDATWKSIAAALGTQAANLIFAGPSSGSAATPGFRVLVGADLPLPSSISLGGVQSIAGSAHNWIASISTSGVPALSQPSFADISGIASATQLPTPTATTLGGVKSKASAAHQFLTQIGTDGSVTAAQPAFTDVSGTVDTTQLPTPTPTTIGGVKSKTSTAHQFLTQIGTDGSVTAAQPAYSDISGAIPAVASLNTLTGALTLSVVKQVFTSSGTYTPTVGTVYAIFEGAGSGAGGGGCAATSPQSSAGGGGGAGSYARTFASAATIGVSQTVTIGAAGIAGAAGNNAGGAGGDVSVGTLLIAKGGSGGGGAPSFDGGIGGAGGIAGTGDFTVVGGDGGSGNGSSGSSATVLSGYGGASFFGGGGKSVAGRSGASAGVAGQAYGAGGSGGAIFSTTTTAAGAAGAKGVVIVTEFVLH